MKSIPCKMYDRRYGRLAPQCGAPEALTLDQLLFSATTAINIFCILSLCTLFYDPNGKA